jgi:hypothetical protein
MPRSLVGSAVAGRLAAAGLELVDGTFDELSQREHLMELALRVGQQGSEGQAQAAGAIGSDGQETGLLFMLYIIKTYRCQDVFSKK